MKCFHNVIFGLYFDLPLGIDPTGTLYYNNSLYYITQKCFSMYIMGKFVESRISKIMFCNSEKMMTCIM